MSAKKRSTRFTQELAMPQNERALGGDRCRPTISRTFSTNRGRWKA
jgi:hypothetical protein